ncbi:hypothetical protein [Pedobacter jamesrossensis]|uniref:Helix-turn-helix domain-containing protein n=1 Tax=Pedobacter jamesrossensis TaxID=1908238 RepID=A0ABV8NLH4_9SPHI
MAQVLTSYSDSEFKEILSEKVKEVLFEFFKNSNPLPLKDKDDTLIYKTRDETRRILKISLTTLYYWEKAEILIPNRIGRRVLYTMESVQAAIQKQKGLSI